MKFEWDEHKNFINKEKHKISFETAAYVFDDPYYIEMYDFEHSVEEDRYIAIGKVGDVLFVVEEEKKSPINFDEDCGELSPAMMKAFKSAVVQRNRKKKA